MFSNPHVGIYYVYKFLENKPLMYLNEMNIKEYPKYNYFEMYIFGKIQSKSRWDRDRSETIQSPGVRVLSVPVAYPHSTTLWYHIVFLQLTLQGLSYCYFYYLES